MRTIIVTGSVGAGKTALSKKLALAARYIYVDVNKIIKKYNLAEGYDRKRKSKIIDADKLSKALISVIKSLEEDESAKGVIIDSHLSHHLPAKYAGLCIIVKCSINLLNKRLKNRGYSKSKIRENLDAEIFNVCLEDAKEKGHRIMVVDTSKGINKNAVSSVVKWVRKRKK